MMRTLTAALIAATLILPLPAQAEMLGPFEGWSIDQGAEDCLLNTRRDGEYFMYLQQPSVTISSIGLTSPRLEPHVGVPVSEITLSVDGRPIDLVDAQIVSNPKLTAPIFMSAFAKEAVSSTVSRPVDVIIAIRGTEVWRGRIDPNAQAQAALAACMARG